MCGGFVAMILIVIGQWYCTQQVLKTLKNRFPEQWTVLGKPTLVMNNSLQNNKALYSFLWHKKYIDLGDETFSKQCSFLRSFSIFSITAASIWLLGGLVFILLNQEK
jgi:hypothetical protein